MAHRARTVTIDGATFAVGTIVGAGASTIDIGFRGVLQAVHARRACHRRRRAGHVDTICVRLATFAVGAIFHARPAAIDIGFRPIFYAIIAGRYRACLHGANVALAIVSRRARLAVGATTARASAIDVHFCTVFRAIATFSRSTLTVLANQCHAIGVHIAFDARATFVAHVAEKLGTWRTLGFERMERCAHGAKVFRAILAVVVNVGVVVLRYDRAISVTNLDETIAGCLTCRGCSWGNVRCDAHPVGALDEKAFIR